MPKMVVEVEVKSDSDVNSIPRTRERRGTKRRVAVSVGFGLRAYSRTHFLGDTRIHRRLRIYASSRKRIVSLTVTATHDIEPLGACAG